MPGECVRGWMERHSTVTSSVNMTPSWKSKRQARWWVITAVAGAPVCAKSVVQVRNFENDTWLAVQVVSLVLCDASVCGRSVAHEVFQSNVDRAHRFSMILFVVLVLLSLGRSLFSTCTLTRTGIRCIVTPAW